MAKQEQYIMVAEPWDFTSPDGENIIKGHIIYNYNARYIIFKANYELIFRQAKGDTLVLSPRHYFGDDRDLLSLNGGLLLQEFSSTMDIEAVKKMSKFVLIGSLHSK